MKRIRIKLLVLLLIVVSAVLFFTFDLQSYFTLSEIKRHQAAFSRYYAENTLQTVLIYMLVYIVVTALSLPGAAVMTLLGGAMFGLGLGLLVVSFASTIGATCAFLVSRFLFRDYVQNRFDDRMAAVNEGIRKEGAFYLFTLRLVPIFPFFVINILMGLTPIKTWIFYLVSQVGMLPGTLVYVNAGTQLAGIDSLQGILSPALLLSFALLGLFPLIAKRLVAFFKAHKVLVHYPRPESFDYNVVVIGAGSAGLVSAYIAAAVKAKVALIEKEKMGGDCLNTGCVPSKALIRTAKMISYARRAEEFGLSRMEVDVDFGRVMERVQAVVEKIAPHDSRERYTSLGVDCISGEAKIESPYTITVEGRTLTTRNIIVATGAGPFVPPIPGLDQIRCLTSDTLWELKTLPKRLVVLGGGPIGCELAQAFSRLGSQVTQVEMLPRILLREDPEVSEFVQKRFAAEGIRVLTGHKATAVRVDDGEKRLICENDGNQVEIDFDEILVAVGRAPNTAGFGLEELGVVLNPNKTVRANELLQTNFPNIYCCGDVAGPFQFTHTASHQAWHATINALFGNLKAFPADYRVIPWATFTDPEVGRVGLNEQDAAEYNVSYEITRYDLSDLDRAITDAEDQGFVKVLTKPGTDKILGVTIVGYHAAEIIAEFVFAMKHSLGLNKIMQTIHIYPTLAEANKFIAGNWKKAHAPETLLRWIEKYHAWRRGTSQHTAEEET